MRYCCLYENYVTVPIQYEITYKETHVFYQIYENLICLNKQYNRLSTRAKAMRQKLRVSLNGFLSSNGSIDPILFTNMSFLLVFVVI